MADVTVKGGSTYATSLGQNQAVIASNLLAHIGPGAINYVAGGGATTVSTDHHAIILSDVNPLGASTLSGNGLNDVLVGNRGDDQFNLSQSGKVVGGGGHDTISTGLGKYRIVENGHATVSGPGYSATVAGGQLSVIDGEGASTITASNGFATVHAGTSSHLVAGSGKDRLSGLGSDTYRGGSGDATMKGQGGSNVFQFGSHGGSDVVLNFVRGSDKIQLKGLTASQAFADSTHVAHVGTVITDGSTTITVKGVHLGLNDFKNG